jgi:hypothetical protein
MNRYQILTTIGEHAYGQISKALNTETQELAIIH